jgi:serine protease Do
MTIATLGAPDTFSSGANGLADLLRRAVVEIRSGGAGCGAGVVWGRSGLVVTNAHCLPRGDSVDVHANGRWHSSRTIAYHPRHDLALLAAGSVTGPLLDCRDAESLRAGELLFACGHPLGVRDALAMGVLHGVARDGRTNRPRWIVADVQLAPGNSGGPLVDAEGRLVGINTMVVNGLGVAIPADVVVRFVERTLATRAA